MMWLESRLDFGMSFVLSELRGIQNESVSRLGFCSPFCCSISGRIAIDPARLSSTATSENSPRVVSAIATKRSRVRKHQFWWSERIAIGIRSMRWDSKRGKICRTYGAPDHSGSYSQCLRTGLNSAAPTALGDAGKSRVLLDVGDGGT
jgi:hypothetical protein